MTALEAFVPIGAIQHAVVGREEEILAALGICWTGRSQHRRAMYRALSDTGGVACRKPQQNQSLQ
jgi:hypothetical protein